VKGVDVKLEVIAHGAMAAFRRMSELDKAKVFRGLKLPTRIDQRQHHQAERAPSARWPALAPSTIERNKYARATKGRKRAIGKGRGQRWRKSLGRISAVMGRKLLRRLPGAILASVTSRSLIWRSRVGWASVHQFGGRAGNGARIPQRQFLWISPWLERTAREHFEKALVATFTRGL